MSLDHARGTPLDVCAERFAVEPGDGLADPHIAVSGELDAATVKVLEEALGSAPGADGELTVDFRRVTFCDLAGLKLLADVGARLRGEGRRLVVYGPCPSLEILLDLSGTAALVELVPAPSP